MGATIKIVIGAFDYCDVCFGAGNINIDAV